MKKIEKEGVYKGVVQFHDCDPLGIVWHGNYFKYMEMARTELMKKVHLDVADFRSMKYKQLVTDAHCRYAFPLQYGDHFQVTARFLDIEMRLRIGYTIKNLTAKKRSARAWTTLVTTDNDFNLLMETPDEIIKKIMD